MSILDVIVADKYRYVEAIKSNLKSLNSLKGYELAVELDKIAYNLFLNKANPALENKHITNEIHKDVFDNTLCDILEKNEFTIIGEIKRGSPSKGLFASDLSVNDKVLEYKKAGIKCISVLTDHNYFFGSFCDLVNVRSIYDGEILNKDFIVDEIQIDIALKLGATVVLLIVASLSDDRLSELYSYALDKGLSIIVEVHNEIELLRALRINPKIIGINNRDLKTFTTDIAVSINLIGRLKEEKHRMPQLISESGINCGSELEKLKLIGFRGALIGESLIRGTQKGVI